MASPAFKADGPEDLGTAGSIPVRLRHLRPAGAAYGGYMRRRRLAYAIMMGTCLTLFVLSWTVVRLWSHPAAIAMAVVALAIPPFAAIVANWNIDRRD